MLAYNGTRCQLRSTQAPGESGRAVLPCSATHCSLLLQLRSTQAPGESRRTVLACSGTHCSLLLQSEMCVTPMRADPDWHGPTCTLLQPFTCDTQDLPESSWLDFLCWMRGMLG